MCLAVLSIGATCGNQSSQSRTDGDQNTDSKELTPEQMVKEGYALTYVFKDNTINIYANKGKYFRMDGGTDPAHNAYIFVKGMGDERRDDIYYEDEGTKSSNRMATQKPAPLQSVARYATYIPGNIPEKDSLPFTVRSWGRRMQGKVNSPSGTALHSR